MAPGYSMHATFPGATAVYRSSAGNEPASDVAIRIGAIWLNRIKRNSLKKADGFLRLSDEKVRIDFTNGEHCDIELKDKAQAEELVLHVEKAVVKPAGSQKSAAASLQCPRLPAGGGASDKVLTSSAAPSTASAQRSSHKRDELDMMSSNCLSKVGRDMPAADSKRAKIDANTGSLEDRSTPEKAARFTLEPVSRQPRRAYVQQSNTLQFAKAPQRSSPQHSAVYRGYRSSVTFGLQNLGNTCYLNAVMQALCSLREFVKDLSAMPDTIPPVADGRLFSGSSEILRQMSNATAASGPLSPAKLRELVAKASPMFAGNQQQDAHEFLLELVNQLHDELLGARKTWLEAQNLPEGEEASGMLSTQVHLDSEVQKTLQCVSCNESRDVSERFRDFSLDFPARPQGAVVVDGREDRCELRSMLEQYFAPELLEAKCEHCAAPAANMFKQLTHAPQVLVLHLKRFVPNVEKQRYEKQHQNVEIPLQFDLKTYLREACAGGGASASSLAASPARSSLPARPLAAEANAGPVWEVLLDNNQWVPFEPHEVRKFENTYNMDPCGSCEFKARGHSYLLDFSTWEQVNQETNRCKPVRRVEPSASPSDGVAGEVSSGLVYNLRSVVAHDGASPHSGHYVCYARSEKGSWRLYDDSLVRELPAGQEALLGRKAYILFYVLQNREARGA